MLGLKAEEKLVEIQEVKTYLSASVIHELNIEFIRGGRQTTSPDVEAKNLNDDNRFDQTRP